MRFRFRGVRGRPVPIQALATNFRLVEKSKHRGVGDDRGIIYDSISSPDRQNSPPPAVTIYTAGFPCQPYAIQGLARGASDVRGKPAVVEVIKYIRGKLPAGFVLENVAGLAHSHKAFFEWILQQLSGTIGSDGTAVPIVSGSVLGSVRALVAQG